MTDAGMYFNELAKEIPNVSGGKMFGASCMKTPNGKSAAMFWNDHLVVKLQGAFLDEAMSLNGTKPFEPMEGRPMNGWVQIPFEYKDHWRKFTLISAESVEKFKK
jgi:hypothetical protein